MTSRSQRLITPWLAAMGSSLAGLLIATSVFAAAATDSLRPRPRAALPPGNPVNSDRAKSAEAPPSTAVAVPTPPPALPPVPAPAPTVLPTPVDHSAPLPPPSLVVPRGDVEISSDGGFEYDGETGRVLYRSKVKVLDPAEDPKTIITAEWLTTVLPPPGGKVGEIVALTNVVIKILDPKGAQIARGNKAVYNATNDIVTIYGDPPVLEMPSGTLYGDRFVVFNRVTSQFQAPGRIRMVAKQGVPILGIGSTNVSPRSGPAPTTTRPQP